ncbi:MAG: response regulator [Ginsengibacter sp.]
MKKVLVVDDDPDILYLVKYVLKNAGFDVCTYSTGLGVTEQVAACSPDVILLDIMLPGRMGTEVCKDLRKAFSIPIIFFSAHANKDQVLRECKAYGFIPKPFNIKDMVSTISECAYHD